LRDSGFARSKLLAPRNDVRIISNASNSVAGAERTPHLAVTFQRGGDENSAHRDFFDPVVTDFG
jgi:hypothetical protein